MFADPVRMNPIKLVRTPSTGARTSGSSMDVVDSLLTGSVEEDISPVRRAKAEESQQQRDLQGGFQFSPRKEDSRTWDVEHTSVKGGEPTDNIYLASYEARGSS